MIKGIHHVALVVQDFDSVLPYYCAAAGLRQLTGSDALAISPVYHELAGRGGTPCGQILLAGPNGYLKLLSHRHPTLRTNFHIDPINRPGIRHFCVQNRDCAALEKAVRGNGGGLIAPPLDLGTGNQYAYARDFEGNIMEIELIEAPREKLCPKPTRFDQPNRPHA